VGCLGAIATFALLAIAEDAQAAAKLTILYRFDGNDGAAPKGRLVFDGDGVAYGTTEGGGDLGFLCCGTVYKLSPPAPGKKNWKQAVLYRFPYPGEQGVRPLNGLLLKGGSLYGAAVNRGATTSSPCCGTIFQLKPSGAKAWKHQTIYTFKNDADGFGPAGDLVADGSGALYGATYAGGKFARGTIFKLTPPANARAKWIKTILYHFKGGKDGAFVRSGLTFDSNGALYGVATQDGSTQDSCCGTIFKLTPPSAGQTKWTYDQLYRFKGDKDGAHPEGRPLVDGDGAVYGTTLHGGEDDFGLVFKLSPPKPGHSNWTKTVLHHFLATGADGNFPTGGLERDGSWNLYGVTQQGGGEGAGTIFKLTKKGKQWAYKVLRSLTHQQAVMPYAGLVRHQGLLYGTTIGDKAFDKDGAIFQLEQ
jgi:uncharacterized repeat protein (TIGR03803 family)